MANDEEPVLIKVDLRVQPHRPGWERFPAKDCVATLEASTHTGTNYVSLWIKEFGTKSTRQSHITLQKPEDLRALMSIVAPGLIEAAENAVLKLTNKEPIHLTASEVLVAHKLTKALARFSKKEGLRHKASYMGQD